jgi:hypothetical protein
MGNRASAEAYLGPKDRKLMVTVCVDGTVFIFDRQSFGFFHLLLLLFFFCLFFLLLSFLCLSLPRYISLSKDIYIYIYIDVSVMYEHDLAGKCHLS